MKKSVLAVLVLGALLLAGPVAAAPIYNGAVVKVTTANLGNASGGGAFWVTSVNNTFDSFMTFCIQRDETVTLGGQYTAYLNTVAVAGNDPVDSQTAWIYSQWLGGNTFNILNAGARANAVQNAIWYIEGELTKTPVLGLTADGLAVYNLAKAVYPDGSPQLLGGVVALNLFTAAGANVQDLLASPVPEPASMLLFGTGLVGLAGAARRRFRK